MTFETKPDRMNPLLPMTPYLLRLPLALLLVLLTGCFLVPDSLTQSGDRARADTLLTMKRTGCWIGCPVYDVTLQDDGTLTYNGAMYVRRVGSIRETVSRATLLEVVKEIRQTEFFDQREEDAMDVSDAAEVALTVYLDGRRKRISRYSEYDESGGMVKLANTIDSLLNTRRWTGR